MAPAVTTRRGQEFGGMDRRGFFEKAAGVFALASTAKARAAGVAGFDAPYAPVLAKAAREIRTVVGHRPYRRTGFVVRAEKHGRRTLVHNYGHGGCGVTLSWGCVRLAMAAAARYDFTEAAVIGAGVIGLTTGITLARRGVRTTVYAAELPPNTTSNIAAALWLPTTLFQLSAVGDAFLEQFKFAARASQEAFQHYANNPRYGVSWIRMLNLADAAPATARPPAFEGDDLYPSIATESDPNRYFGFPYVERHYGMMIDPDIYLAALMEDFHRAGGRIVQRRFENPDEVFDLDDRMIFNCTGFGARALFGDEELTPIRGQLTMILPQPEIDYGYVYPAPSGLLYMFPRKGALVLGGTVEYGNGSAEISEADRTRMLAGHAALAARIGAR